MFSDDDDDYDTSACKQINKEDITCTEQGKEQMVGTGWDHALKGRFL